MDDPLERLIRDLRSEKCPLPVIDRVAHRIARDRAASRSRRFSFLPKFVGALSAVVLAVTIVRMNLPRRDPPAPASESPMTDHAKVIAEAHEALAVIGHILIATGTQAESSLLDEAVPPLLRSLHTVKAKVNPSL